MHQERYTWLVKCDVLLVWCMYDECWWVNDECWCIKDDERMWSVDDEWMMNVYGWMIMNVVACLWMWDVCWMVYDALMHLWCVMQWCMLNMLMSVKYMCIFCHHNCILYWFCNCCNVLILIFVFVCLSGLKSVLCCTCNKTMTHTTFSVTSAHEPVTCKTIL